MLHRENSIRLCPLATRFVASASADATATRQARRFAVLSLRANRFRFSSVVCRRGGSARHRWHGCPAVAPPAGACGYGCFAKQGPREEQSWLAACLFCHNYWSRTDALPPTPFRPLVARVLPCLRVAAISPAERACTAKPDCCRAAGGPHTKQRTAGHCGLDRHSHPHGREDARCRQQSVRTAASGFRYATCP